MTKEKVLEVEAWPCCVLLKLYFIFWRLHLLRECQVSLLCICCKFTLLSENFPLHLPTNTGVKYHPRIILDLYSKTTKNYMNYMVSLVLRQGKFNSLFSKDSNMPQYVTHISSPIHPFPYNILYRISPPQLQITKYISTRTGDRLGSLILLPRTCFIVHKDANLSWFLTI